MRSLLVLVVALAGCSDGADPHAGVECNWSSVTTSCESACAAMPAAGIDANGDGMDDSCALAVGGFCPSSAVSAFDGDRYCCGLDTTGSPFFMKAYECEAQ